MSISSKRSLLCPAITALLAVIAISHMAVAQSVAIYSSSEEGDRLTRLSDVEFIPDGSTFYPLITVDEQTRHQRMDGFGATFNEAGMICLNSLSAEAKDGVFQMLFDAETGAGFTLMKAPFGSCDFTSAGPWFSYNDTPGDVEMTNFSVQRDLRRNGMLTFIKEASRFGSFEIEACMDFAPDWMYYGIKPGQKHIRPEYYDALALYYSKYIQAYAANGVTINYLNLFNEPDNSWYSEVTYDEIAELIKDHVAPRLAADGLATKIQLGETANRPEGWAEFPSLLADPDLREHISGMTVHGYDRDDFWSVAALHEAYPDIPVWMTEVCYYSFSAGAVVPVYDFSDGANWGNMIMGDVNNGVSGWIYWNMILDQNGGPCLVSEAHGDPPYNSQHPVVIINRTTKQVTYTGLYYYLAHFSRFVRPGAYRIACDWTSGDLNCAAFQNSDGGIVLVVINNGDETDVSLSWNNAAAALHLKANSITTMKWAVGS